MIIGCFWVNFVQRGLSLLSEDATKKATTKPHGLDKKKIDTLACASKTAFIPFGRGNAWREIMDKYKKEN